MKIAMILLGLFVAYAAADGNEFEKRFKKAYMHCADVMDPDIETIKILTESKDYDNKEANCFRACVMKQLDGINDGKINVEKLWELLKLNSDLSDQKIKAIVKIMKTCKGKAEVSNDNCDVTGLFIKCTVDAIKAAQKAG